MRFNFVLIHPTLTFHDHLFFARIRLPSEFTPKLSASSYQSCPPLQLKLRRLLADNNFLNSTVNNFTSIISYKPDQAEQEQIHRIRITLTSKKVDALEKICQELKNKALEKNLKVFYFEDYFIYFPFGRIFKSSNIYLFKIKGPVRIPTKILRLVVRKSPCGEGTNTFDRWQMRIHKRILDLYASSDLVRQITNIAIEPGVSVEVTICAE